jgi:hypothetical protein
LNQLPQTLIHREGRFFFIVGVYQSLPISALQMKGGETFSCGKLVYYVVSPS